MDPLKVKIRDGCRGGLEQFKWNSIKEQEFKDRECYLGASTKVGMMTKFARYYVHDWYTKKRETTDSIDSEREAVQAYEEELMQEALGQKPKKLILAKRQLTEEEMQELLRRDDQRNNDKKGREAMGPQKKVVTNEHGEAIATSNEELVAVAARDAPIKGIGFASHRTAKLEAIKAKTTGTVGQLQGCKEQGPVKLEVKLEMDEHQGGSSSSSFGVRVKEEPQIKQEQEDGKSDAGVRKRGLSAEEDSVERGRRKAAKKEAKKEKKEKKRRKAEKKLKKAEKKLKKQIKKEQKLRERMGDAARRSGRTSATPERPSGGWKSSSSSSSSSS